MLRLPGISGQIFEILYFRQIVTCVLDDCINIFQLRDSLVDFVGQHFDFNGIQLQIQRQCLKVGIGLINVFRIVFRQCITSSANFLISLGDAVLFCRMPVKF